MRRRDGESGFSLIETMIATMLLATAVAGTAQLMVIATRGNIAAQRSTFATTLAQDKIETLRGLAWGFDELGLPINDYTTNLTVDPPTNDGVGLSPSPGDSLAANTTNYVDYLDRDGRIIGTGPTVPNGASFVRRWSIEPLPTNPNNTLILQVMVYSTGDRVDDGEGVVLDRVRDEARLVSVKTRKSR
ncbi:MAG TPA: type II secretion system protein [Vicinamibacterales bacterium]|nr:type II secretion system protein [Vicinamibacterales bacterium]